MSVLLTEGELAMFSNLPETDLVDLAIELDVAVGEQFSPAELLSEAVRRLADLGGREGLPFSNYDLDELAALEPDELTALASLLGCPPDPAQIVKQGERVYRSYRKTRPKSQIPLMLPMLLAPLVRHLTLSL